MKKRTIGKIVVLAVIVVAAYPLYQYWAERKEYENFRHFFDGLSQVLEDVGAENQVEKISAYKEEITGWNRKAGTTLDRFFSNYQGAGAGNIEKAIGIVKTFMEHMYELRNESIPFAEQLFAGRMLNPRTVKDDMEYEWRMRVLGDVSAYEQKYRASELEVPEAFRAMVVKSDLPEKYRVYIWNRWGGSLHHYISLMSPPVEMLSAVADNDKKLFRFLHEYKEAYYIDEKGNVFFDDKRLAAEYQTLLIELGVTWPPL